MVNVHKTFRMKELRLRVPDPNSPEFRREARRQVELLRGAAEEDGALAFIEEQMDQGIWTG